MKDEISIDFIIAETERLIIREFNPDDVEAVYEYCGNAENTYYMDWGPESLDGVKTFVNNKLAEQIVDPRKNFDFAICIKEGRKLIGSVGLTLDEKMQQAELGYILHRDFHGNGYATEATEAMLKFGFLNLNLHRIYARCDSENIASESVMKKLRMRKEAENKYSVYTHVGGREQWRSEKGYAILQTEFLKRFFSTL